MSGLPNTGRFSMKKALPVVAFCNCYAQATDWVPTLVLASRCRGKLPLSEPSSHHVDFQVFFESTATYDRKILQNFNISEGSPSQPIGQKRWNSYYSEIPLKTSHGQNFRDPVVSKLWISSHDRFRPCLRVSSKGIIQIYHHKMTMKLQPTPI